MPNRIDAPMQKVQAPRANPEPHGIGVETDIPQLPHRDNPKLPRRDLRDPDVGWGEKVGHIPTKAPRPLNSPPYYC
jgi:hypothetical protein